MLSEPQRKASSPTKPASEEAPPVQVDPERASRFIAEIREIELSDEIKESVRGYETVGHRNLFLWKWVRRGGEITTLSSVEESLWDSGNDTKTLGVVLDVLLDDVADEGDDPQYLDDLLSITRHSPVSTDHLDAEKKAYFDYTALIWKTIWARLATYPRFEEFRDVLDFDYAQLMNAMRYAFLLRKHPSIMNMPEHDTYQPHNMHMVINGTIDLMVSPDFDIAELGDLRRVLLLAQYMGRIGNLVTTWEREIREKDYSSGVFSLALSRGIVTLEDLIEGDQQNISQKIRASDVEETFLRRWSSFRGRILRLGKRLKTVDVSQIVDGLDTLIQLHLGSRGLK